MCASVHLHIQQTAGAVRKVLSAADLINVGGSNAPLSRVHRPFSHGLLSVLGHSVTLGCREGVGGVVVIYCRCAEG